MRFVEMIDNSRVLNLDWKRNFTLNDVQMKWNVKSVYKVLWFLVREKNYSKDLKLRKYRQFGKSHVSFSAREIMTLVVE